MASNSTDSKLPYDDNDKGPQLLRVLWTLLAISSVVVAARLWTKIRRTHRLYYDDGLMVLALALGCVHAATITIAVHYGLGRHYLYLSPFDRNQSIRMGVINIAFAMLSPCAGRIAFCVTLLFLTGTDPHVQKWPIILFMVLQAVINTCGIIVFYTQCGTQLDIFWTPAKYYLEATHCYSPIIQTKIGYFVGAFNCFTDAFLTVLPAILINHSKLSLKRKLGIACLLCLSIVALVAAIVKTYAMKALSEVSDYTYDLCYYVVCSSVELNIVIIVSSIPILRSLFRRQRRPGPVDADIPGKLDTATRSSMFSRKGARATTSHLSTSSQEDIVPHMPQQYEMETQPGITVTTEVSVSYHRSDAPYVHAALVGLIQGELANPALVQR